MRSFAQICVNLPDGGDIAKKLEGVLNTNFAIADRAKASVFTPKVNEDSRPEDYQTVDPGLLAQPEFPFLPAGIKIARIEEYHRLKRELEKSKEVRRMLEKADEGDALTQRRLMNSHEELDSILGHLDADPLSAKEHGKYGDLWFFERMKKVSGSIDGLVGKIIGEDLGHHGISWGNIEQVYNPLVSGVASISEQR